MHITPLTTIILSDRVCSSIFPILTSRIDRWSGGIIIQGGTSPFISKKISSVYRLIYNATNRFYSRNDHWIVSVQIKGHGEFTATWFEVMQFEELTKYPNCIVESSRFHFNPAVVTWLQVQPPNGMSPQVTPSLLSNESQRVIILSPGGNTRRLP